MDAAEDQFIPLSKLTPSTHRGRVRVRVSRMWLSFNPNDNDRQIGLDSLLIDDQGGAMQARVQPIDIKQLKERLVEGKVYALSDFTVRPSQKSSMTCANCYMMYIGSQTVVNEIEGNVKSIPLHHFDFVDFDDVSSRIRINSLLTDVVGQIVHVGAIQQVRKQFHRIQLRSIEIWDLSGRKLCVTLYGDLGCNFDVEMVVKKGQEAPVVAIFAGMRVQFFTGKGFIVRSSPPSKYYLDLEIPEVQEFRAKLCNLQTPTADLPCQKENSHENLNPLDSTGIAQDLIESFRTIEQLKSLNKLELQNTRYLCRVTLNDIDCTRDWCYLSCSHCRCSISGDGKKFWCDRCEQNDQPPVRMYKLDAVVEDPTGTMNFMIFGEQARD